MAYFDTHAHIQDIKFESDLDEVLARAADAGVSRILVPGTDLEDSRQALELARTNQMLYCSVGFHPHTAKDFDESALHEIRSMARDDKVLAIGEIGLDYHYDFSPREIQQQVFRQQIKLASELRLPMIIHDREATEDCLEILKEAQADGLLSDMPGVFHCFSGSWETARIVIDLGFYLGFDGPITYRNAKKAPDIISRCPHDRLLIETDSPYLTPEPYRGRRNEPARVTLVAAKVAEIWSKTAAETGNITEANACRLFGLDNQ